MTTISTVSLIGAVAGVRSPRPSRAVEGLKLEDLANIESLREGWAKVRANKGGPGGDGVTIDAFATKLDHHLGHLAAALLEGLYWPGKLRHAKIPKANGEVRTLSIPAVADRVVQSALLVVLAPLLDPHMSDASCAYRPGRGVKDAIWRVQQGFAEGFVWSVDADIASYFDRVPHARLIDELTIWIDDERLISLISRWLRRFSLRGRGIAQGSPISPLLANLYLHPVDRLLVAGGYRVVRYADDLVVQARTKVGAAAARATLARLLNARGLTLNAAKTRIVAPGQEFTFLGQVLVGAVHDL